MSQATATSPDITFLLNEARRGNRDAEAHVFAVLLRELRRTAAAYLRRERHGHTLSPTALVNEAYIKLTGYQRMEWRNRAQFFGTAARVMRRILVDHARATRASKRGGGGLGLDPARLDPAGPHPGRLDAARPARAARAAREDVSLDSIAAAPASDAWQILAIDRALDRLALLDARQARIVECRCFAGLDVRETAHALGVSPTTVKREWQMARAWLYRELHGAPAQAAHSAHAASAS